MQTLTFRVTGRVQGVCYRMWTADTARAFGVKGWVRNLPDGSVEGRAQGAEADLRRFGERLREGPPAARVAEVRTEIVEAPERFVDFAIRR